MRFDAARIFVQAESRQLDEKFSPALGSHPRYSRIQAISGALIWLVLAVNTVGILYPAQLSSATVVWEMMRLMSSYGTPPVLMLVVLMSTERQMISGNLLVIGAACLAAISFLVSGIFNGSGPKGMATAVFFLISSIAVFGVYQHHKRLAGQFVHVVFLTLVLWMVVPIILLIDPDARGLLVNKLENSFHGLADSRIGYALWASILAVLTYWQLSLGYAGKFNSAASGRYFYLNILALVAVLGGIYFAQSRAAVVGLALATIYYLYTSKGSVLRKCGYMSLTLLLAVGIMASWKAFGRQEPLKLVDPSRVEIANEYYAKISPKNIVLGQGSQVSVKSPDQDFGDGRKVDASVTQAHSLPLQWVANFGVVGAALLMVFLLSVWLKLRSKWARMLYLIFITFSFTQPIQGTANFFSPVTLLIFFLIIGVDVCAIERAIKNPDFDLRSEASNAR